MTQPITDLVCLVADKDMEQALKGLLDRHPSLAMREITFDVFVHPLRDPGCANEAQTFLRPLLNQYDYALVLFDHDGSGHETTAADDLETNLENQLKKNGWTDRARVIVLRPELEIWVWSESRQVDECLGWAGRQPDLRSWLRQQGFLTEDSVKPDNPKEALERALRIVQKPRSAALYNLLAQKVSLKSCIDPSFDRLRATLQDWFLPDNQGWS